MATTTQSQKKNISVASCLSVGDSRSWNVDIEMSIRPSTSTGVVFALVYNSTVPLSLAVLAKGDEDAVS